MATINSLPSLGSLVLAYEIPLWNTADNKTYNITVSQLLALDVLETTGTGNIRTRANSNVVAGGYNAQLGANNVITGSSYYNLLIGDGNSVEGNQSLASGKSNTVVGDSHLAVGELNSIADPATYGAAIGYSNKVIGNMNLARGQGALAFRFGELSSASKKFAYAGDNQMSVVHAQLLTPTDNSVNELTLAGDDILILEDTTVAFEAHLTGALHTGSPGSLGDSEYKVIRGLIKNVGGTVSLVGSVVTTAICNDTEADWNWTITADNTDKKLKITIQAQNLQEVRAFATVFLFQVGFDGYTA